jgi:hypothetical protein
MIRVGIRDILEGAYDAILRMMPNMPISLFDSNCRSRWECSSAHRMIIVASLIESRVDASDKMQVMPLTVDSTRDDPSIVASWTESMVDVSLKCSALFSFLIKANIRRHVRTY